MDQQKFEEIIVFFEWNTIEETKKPKISNTSEMESESSFGNVQEL